MHTCGRPECGSGIIDSAACCVCWKSEIFIREKYPTPTLLKIAHPCAKLLDFFFFFFWPVSAERVTIGGGRLLFLRSRLLANEVIVPELDRLLGLSLVFLLKPPLQPPPPCRGCVFSCLVVLFGAVWQMCSAGFETLTPLPPSLSDVWDIRK